MTFQNRLGVSKILIRNMFQVHPRPSTHETSRSPRCANTVPITAT
jgi:hypothetical protein